MAKRAGAAVLMRMEERLAAWVAADRAMAAAEKAGNLLLAAGSQYPLAEVFLDCREYALADEMARSSMIALRGLAEVGDPDALSLCGGLTLLRAAVAARTRRPAAAYGHVAKARPLPTRRAAPPPKPMPALGA